ncbi:MAG: hypothetical protein UD961_00295 [Bacteroidales bacterium]|nr:hypothetical protein [Bacteroidales bacterium]
MKNQILNILLLMMTVLSAVSCDILFDDISTTPNEGAIVLHFRTPDVAVKGTIEDNACESYMSHLDVLIYKYNGTTYEPFHYERISVSATPEGKVSLHRKKEDFEADGKYKFYVVANSTLEQTAYKPEGSIISHDNFLKLDQTDRLIHLSGVDHDIMNPHYPQMFLMDGVAYIGDSEPATPGLVVVNDPRSKDDVVLKVTLRRAAAKILITIIPGDKVTFESKLMALSDGYLIRNMPNRSTLVKEGGVAKEGEVDRYPLTDGDKNPYWESTTISQSPYFNLVEVDGKKQVELTAYCYSHSWIADEVFEKGTSVVMMLPMIYKESDDKEAVEYINNYYQLSVTKNQTIKRNTVYDLRITLNAPGAEDITTPEEVKEIQYFTAPWEVVDLPISGENTVRYLKVNKEKIYMYNVDEDNTSLYFSSSSPVSVDFVSGSAYYYNKFNEKITLGNTSTEVKSISGSTVSGAVSGNISVHSNIPTNNTIRYFQLKITNKEGLSEVVDVEQYPLIYITNNLPWYSYRDDYYHRTTGGHKWNGNTDQMTTAGDQPTTYRYAGDHIVSVYQIEDVSTTSKQVKYTYTSAIPSSNHGFTASKYRGTQSGNNYNIMYYSFSYEKKWWDAVGKWSMNTSNRCETHNVRNYHVRMMASSGDYIVGRPALDEYGYTAGDDDNAKLVSPSFVIASRLGAVLSTYSGLSSMSNDKKLVAFADHCKNYVEVDDVNDDKKDPVEVHDNWRLPTKAELEIIINIQGESGQNADAIDYLLNGAYYMSASGPVYNPKNSDGSSALANPMDAKDVAIRCVRDAF